MLLPTYLPIYAAGSTGSGSCRIAQQPMSWAATVAAAAGTVVDDYTCAPILGCARMIMSGRHRGGSAAANLSVGKSPDWACVLMQSLHVLQHAHREHSWHPSDAASHLAVQQVCINPAAMHVMTCWHSLLVCTAHGALRPTCVKDALTCACNMYCTLTVLIALQVLHLVL
jgi:hypothetical protein